MISRSFRLWPVSGEQKNKEKSLVLHLIPNEVDRDKVLQSSSSQRQNERGNYPKWAYRTWPSIWTQLSLIMEQPGQVHLKMSFVRFFWGSSHSPLSLSIPSSLDEGVGLALLKWGSTTDNVDEFPPKLPENPGPFELLSHDEAPDELDELQEDEIIPLKKPNTQQSSICPSQLLSVIIITSFCFPKAKNKPLNLNNYSTTSSCSLLISNTKVSADSRSAVSNLLRQ